MLFTDTLRYDQPPPSEPLIFEGSPDEDVDIGEWEISEGGDLMTSGSSSCILLVAHNEASRKGLLGHFSAIDEPGQGLKSDKASFLEAIAAIHGLGDPSQTSIWVGGGAPFTEGDKDTAEPMRDFAEKTVHDTAKSLGLSAEQTRFQWSQPNHVLDIELDCQLGCLLVHDYPKQ